MHQRRQGAVAKAPITHEVLVASTGEQEREDDEANDGSDLPDDFQGLLVTLGEQGKEEESKKENC